MPGKPRDYIKKITYCTQGIPLWTRDTNYLLSYFLSLSLTFLGSYPQHVSRIIYIFNSFSIWTYTFTMCALIKASEVSWKEEGQEERESLLHMWMSSIHGPEEPWSWAMAPRGAGLFWVNSEMLSSSMDPSWGNSWGWRNSGWGDSRDLSCHLYLDSVIPGWVIEGTEKSILNPERGKTEDRERRETGNPFNNRNKWKKHFSIGFRNLIQVSKDKIH